MMVLRIQPWLTNPAIPSVRPDSIGVVGVVVVEPTSRRDVAHVVGVGGIRRREGEKNEGEETK